MQSKTTKFGILKGTREDERYFYIYNSKGEQRKISKNKFRNRIPKIKLDCERLKGKPIVTIRPKSELSESNWFTGIYKDAEYIFEMSIEKLISNGETIDCEFKESFFKPSFVEKGKSVSKIDKKILRFNVFKHINSFLNTNSGVVLIGIIDTKNSKDGNIIKGIEDDDFIDEDQYQRTFLEYFEGAFDKNVCDLVETSFVSVNGKKIFRINCKKSLTPVFFDFFGENDNKNTNKKDKEWKDVAFIRQGSSAKMPTLKEWDKWSKIHFK